jgi:hypothetical protein
MLISGKVGDVLTIQGSFRIMFKRVCLIAAVVALTSPALAESCGSAPLAPEIPGVGALSGKTTEDAHAFVIASVKTVKAYQGTLQSYRECLITQTNAQKAVVAEAKSKGDKTKTDAAMQDMKAMQAAYDKTVDTETQVVADWQTLHTAYCKMDGAKCPAPK